MKLSEQVAALEAESELQKGEIERLRAQIHRQEGAIKEGRAERQDLLNKLEKITSVNAYLTQHFHTIHGSAEHLSAEQKQIAALYQPPEIAVETPKKFDIFGPIRRAQALKEKPHEVAQVDHPGKDTGSVRAENGNAR